MIYFRRIIGIFRNIVPITAIIDLFNFHFRFQKYEFENRNLNEAASLLFTFSGLSIALSIFMLGDIFKMDHQAFLSASTAPFSLYELVKHTEDLGVPPTLAPAIVTLITICLMLTMTFVNQIFLAAKYGPFSERGLLLIGVAIPVFEVITICALIIPPIGALLAWMYADFLDRRRVVITVCSETRVFWYRYGPLVAIFPMSLLAAALNDFGLLFAGLVFFFLPILLLTWCIRKLILLVRSYG